MDVLEFCSDEERPDHDNNSSNGANTNTENCSTDHDQPAKKSKLIRKHYEPIRDGSVFLRFEDDPDQYKRLRKKIQNRESAARVRGRKNRNMESLEQEVDALEKVNSELLLKNASLETENRSLKNEIEFLRSILQNQTQAKPPSTDIDQYLNLSKSDTHSQHHDYESPFEEDSAMQWVRESYSSGTRSNWTTLFIVTMIICVFVLPPDSSGSESVLAQQMGTTAITPAAGGVEVALMYGKQVARYLLVGLYALFVGSFMYSRLWRRKSKKV